MDRSQNKKQPHQAKGDKTRAEIMGCANRLFYGHGYEGTSFSQIVEASGLSRGNIYHYFKSKDDILRAVIDQRLDDYRMMLDKWESDFTDPKGRLYAFADMLIEKKSELTKYGCPIGSLNMELGKDRRDLQSVARALFDLFRGWLSERFTEMGRGDEAEALALHVLGRAQGISMIAHVYQDPIFLKHETKSLQTWIDQQVS